MSSAGLLRSAITTNRRSSFIQQRKAGLTTFAMAGIGAFPDRPLQLLPLLESGTDGFEAVKKLERINKNANSRVAFTVDASEWISTVHIFPSAYPRSHPASTSPPSQPLPELDLKRVSLDKTEERKAREQDFEIWDRLSKMQSIESFYPPINHKEAGKQADCMTIGDEKQPQLWSTIQRLAPKRPVQGGITLFLAHANGFHKEVYEPTMQSLLTSLSHNKAKVPIAEIWSMDTIDSGQAGIMNEGSLGPAVSWFDQSRDMLQFLDYYLPLPNSSDSPSTFLNRNSKGKARRERKVVGVGHSFNGAGMMMLGSVVPDAFDGVFIIDPVGVTPEDFVNLPVPADSKLARGAIARKDIFSNRLAAAEYMKSKPFFTAWDPRVLELHLCYGLRSFPGQETEQDPPLTLCQSKWREAFSYSSSFLGTFSYAQVERSRFQGWSHLICMSDSDKVFFGQRGSGPLLKRFEKSFSPKASSELMQGGHLVVLEQPDKLGIRLADILIKHAGEGQTREAKGVFKL